MKRRLMVPLAILVAMMFLTGSSIASPFTFGTAGSGNLQGALDDITVGGDSSVDVTQDALTDNTDSYWGVTASGASVSTLIIELAGYAGSNTFGVFDYSDPSQRVEIFDGASSTGAQATLGIKDSGEVYLNTNSTGTFFAGNQFGFYLDASIGNKNDNAIFFSDTALNEDGVDHMAAYQGTNTDDVKIGDWAAGLWTSGEYILAFEDLWEMGDGDYADFVTMVESVNPVPEPASMLLMGTGLIGMAGFARYRRKRNSAEQA